MEKLKNNFYYLMKDILKSLPDNFRENFLSIINDYAIAKETSRKILLNEINEKKPSFRILYGGLILQNCYLRKSSRGAMYEVMEVVEAIKYCFSKSKLIKLNRLSSEAILRLFCILYLEYILIPTRSKEGKVFIRNFKKHFSKEDIVKAIRIQGISVRYIFEGHMVELGYGQDRNKRLKETLEEFYS